MPLDRLLPVDRIAKRGSELLAETGTRIARRIGVTNRKAESSGVSIISSQSKYSLISCQVMPIDNAASIAVSRSNAVPVGSVNRTVRVRRQPLFVC